MNFNELKEYLLDEGCSVENIEGDVYIAKNCVNGEICLIENLSFYTVSTLAHLFYELNINIPESLQDIVHVYTNFRKKIKIETE